jgi:hypothetical protein
VAKCLITEALKAGPTVDAPMQLEHARPAKLTAEPTKVCATPAVVPRVQSLNDAHG